MPREKTIDIAESVAGTRFAFALAGIAKNTRACISKTGPAPEIRQKFARFGIHESRTITKSFNFFYLPAACINQHHVQTLCMQSHNGVTNVIKKKWAKTKYLR